MGKNLFVIVLFLVQGFHLFATEQQPDILIYNGERYNLTIYPMEYYFKNFPEKHPLRLRSSPPPTSLYRGYIATFEIIQNELWVIDLKNSNNVSIINEVLNGLDRMKVDWFNGRLVIPQGSLVIYMTYERYIILQIQNGNFIREININNEQYIELRGMQFEQYKQTEAYRQYCESIRDWYNSEEQMENSIRIVFFNSFEDI
jgi:hypothetical protein